MIVVRADKPGMGTVIQCYDLDKGAKTCQFVCKEKISFWTWVTDNKLALVGQNSVYHCDLESASDQGTNEPKKVFDRNADMANCQIMSYDMCSDGKWCYLIGLYAGEGNQIQAKCQLYSLERNQGQIMQVYAGCFTQMPVTDVTTYNNSLFCFAKKEATDANYKLFVMDVGAPAPGQPKHTISVDISMAADAQGDFPVLMQASPKYGVIFLMTKFGYFFMFEASTGALIYRQRITDQMPFVSVRNPSTDGMISINRAGQVHSINVDAENLIKYIAAAQHIPNNGKLSFTMASRFGLSGADDIFKS